MACHSLGKIQRQSGVMKILPPNVDTIPQDLKNISQWVIWQAAVNEGKPKPDKIPVNPATRKAASSTNPTNWHSFEVACCVYYTLRDQPFSVYVGKKLRVGPIAGVGFVLTASDPFVGIDIDNCVSSDGGITAFAQEIIDKMDSYTEISPSGTGIRIFVKGSSPVDGYKKAELGLEVYQSKRYLTVTGNALCNRPIRETQQELDWLHTTYGPKRGKEHSAELSSENIVTLDDSSLIERILSSKSRGKFQQLYEKGDLTQNNDDHSSADLALCSMLAFWTGKNAEQIDRIFRTSALMREKWDVIHVRGETYGNATIEKAIESTQETYRMQKKDYPSNTSGLACDEKALMPLPPVPLEVFPETVQVVLQEAVSAYGVPMEIVVATFLAFCSCLIGQARTIRIKQDWEEAANLWIAIVAPSGTGKSPVMTAFMRHVMHLEYQAKVAHDKAKDEYEKALTMHNMLKKDFLKSHKNPKAPPALTMIKPIFPKRKRATVDDATTEAIGDILEDNPKGIMVFRDELSGWLGDMDKYSGSKSGDKARFLSGHSRTAWVTSRASKNGRDNFIPEACVGILGSIQPGLMPKVFEAGTGGVDEESGFLPRFSFIHAEHVGAATWRDATLSQQSVESLKKIASHFWQWEVKLDETGRAERVVISVSPDAKNEYVEWYDAIANEAFVTNNAAPLRKLQATALRLCLILHSVEGCLSDSGDSLCVNKDTMRKAIALANWLKQHQERCWSFFSPAQKSRQFSELEKAIMQIVIANQDTIVANNGKIRNADLVEWARNQLGLPTLSDVKIGKAASRLGLNACTIGKERGRAVNTDKIEEFKATVGTVESVELLDSSAITSLNATVGEPSQPVGGAGSADTQPTVADSGTTVPAYLERLLIPSVNACSTGPTLPVPDVVHEAFAAAYEDYARYTVPHNVN